MSIARLRYKLMRFVRLESGDRRLLLRAAACLAIARIKLVTTPFRRLSAQLSIDCESTDIAPDADILRRIGFALRVAANHVPWRSDCFPQTIAARMLLKRVGYGSTIHIGVEPGGDDAIAGHAWLTCGETIVVGGEEVDRYVEMHRFGA